MGVMTILEGSPNGRLCLAMVRGGRGWRWRRGSVRSSYMISGLCAGAVYHYTISPGQVRSPAPPLEQKAIIAFANDPWATTLSNPPLRQRFGPLGPLPAARAADGLSRTLGVPPRVVKFHELIHQRPPERRTREEHRIFIQKNPTPSVGYARRTGRGHNHQRHRISSHLSMDTT
jgi:hypothetical protein